MEGYAGYDEPRREVAFAWAPGWNSPQAWNKCQDEVGGPLRAGDPGVRLLAPLPGDYDYVRDLPAAFAPRDEQWLAVPQPRLFGGEETSARAEPIQARMDATRFTLSARTAERLRLTPDAAMTLILGERRLTLPVTISATWPDGTVGVPSQAGLPLAAPEWARLEAGEVSA